MKRGILATLAVVSALEKRPQYEVSLEDYGPTAEQMREAMYPVRARLERDVEELNESGYALEAEDLAYLSRVLYFEGAFDPKAESLGDIREGYAAIASVIKNRWEFDQKHGKNKFRGDDGLLGVSQKSKAFSCIDLDKGYFVEEKFSDAWGDIDLIVGKMNSQRLALAYHTLVSVLAGEISDPTQDAVFYVADYVEADWNGDIAFALDNRTLCLRRGPTVQVNTHEFYEVDCGDKKE